MKDDTIDKAIAKIGQTPPKVITDLKDQIENEIKAAELRMSVPFPPVLPDWYEITYRNYGEADLADLQRIVEMKLKLDSLYMLWIEDKL